MLSLIIPTRNRADFLEKAIRSLRSQTLSKNRFELIVVDNGSTDHTSDLAQTLAREWPNLRYFLEPEPGLHVGRHRGLAESTNELLVFADDDIQATPTWLEAIKEQFLDPDCAMVGGNNLPDFQGPVPDWLESLWQRPMFGGQAITQLSVLSLPAGVREINPYFVFGCNFSVRKSVVLEAGGFHPDGVPNELIRFRGDGESHISKHVADSGMKCIFDSRASVYHAVTEQRMSFEYFRRQAFNHGISDSFTALRESPPHKSSLGPIKSMAQWFTTKKSDRRRWDMGREPRLKELSRLVRDGYSEGFRFHQEQYQADPEVRAWVHKPDYYPAVNLGPGRAG
ncbi:glycosyltransferase [Pseudomonadota bacterium]